MSSPYHKEEHPTPERVDDLMLRDDDPGSRRPESNGFVSARHRVAHSRIVERNRARYQQNN